MEYICRMAIDLSLQTYQNYSLEKLDDMPADVIIALYCRHVATRQMTGRYASDAVPDKWTGTPGSHPSIPEKYRTGRSEVSLGGGKSRVTQKINIMDLWDHPELLGNIPGMKK